MIEITREQSAEVVAIPMDAMRQMHEEMQKTFLPERKGECANTIAALAAAMDTRAHVAFADIYNEFRAERESAKTQANAEEGEIHEQNSRLDHP